jgi:hypothetical protein
MRFSCKTFFDITATGVTGHYKSSRVPFRDRTGENIDSEFSWNYARNQQRNWETITQLIGMRTQIFDLTDPALEDDLWYFEFEVETPDVFGTPENPVEILLSDANGVPMLTRLDEIEDISPIIVTSGDKQNIWFSALL